MMLTLKPFSKSTPLRRKSKEKKEASLRIVKIYSKLTFFCKVRRIPNDDTTPSRPATWAPPVNVDVPAMTSR